MNITPATQLQIAEQWLREAVAHLTATKQDRSLRDNLARVASDLFLFSESDLL